MTMPLQVRNVYDVDEGSDLTLDGVILGAPGDEGNAPVELAQLELDATVGSQNFEVTQGGDFVATVNGRNYVVGLALVQRRGGGGLDDRLVFFGVPTDYTPGDSAAAADALAEDKAGRKADDTDRPSRRR
jgi:hypothetical protein